jgi:hypothetical protein
MRLFKKSKKETGIDVGICLWRNLKTKEELDIHMQMEWKPLTVFRTISYCYCNG